MGQDLTDSGIACIGPLPWGTHFCHFYDNRQDLADTLVPYFKVGLEAGEGCLWVAAPPLGAEAATSMLRTAVPDLDRRMKASQIEIIDHHQWYTPWGHFDADAVLAGWIAKKEAALERGFTGLRVTGNTFWIEDPAGFASFTDYEARLNEGFKAHQMVCVCSYCLSRTAAKDVLSVVRNHEFAVSCQEGNWDVVENAALKIAKGELNRLNEKLEHRVAERTRHLERAIADKEVLLREIHHRVKNNLQIINSLLILKKGRLSEIGAPSVIEDILMRINAISLVHESLYLKSDTHDIDFSAYLSELANGLVCSYGMESAIQINVTSAGGTLGLNDAIPLGLIATEIITNSLKHAFPNGRSGNIDIAFSNLSQSENALLIHDTGIGMLTDRPLGKIGAGMTLTKGLVAQVGGTASFGRDGGTTFTLRFPAA